MAPSINQTHYEILHHSTKITKHLLAGETGAFGYFLVTPDSRVDLEIWVEMDAESHLILDVASWLLRDQVAKITIRSVGHGSYGRVTIRSYNVLKDGSQAEVLVESAVRPNTVQNFVDQHITGLLLSPHARMNGQPVLIMQSEDVVAKHSLHLGSVDTEELFYLMSRQLSYEDARMLLIWSSLVKHFKPVQDQIMCEIGKEDENFSQEFQEKLSLIQE